MGQLRLGIVGCGRMGQVHARAAESLGARVAALCDVDGSRANDLALQLQGRPTVSDPELLDCSGLDAVFVCTPPGSRGPIELKAVRAGVPVFMEKPIGLNAQQLQPVLQELVSHPVVHSVGYMNRYRPTVLQARDRLSHSHALGVAFYWAGRPYNVPWWRREDQSGGPFNEQATHLIDLARYIAGDIVEVHAMASWAGTPAAITEAVAVNLRFRGGFLGTGFYSCGAAEKQIGFNVFLADGHVGLEGWNFNLRANDFRAQSVEAEPETYLREVRAFLRAVETSDQSLILCDLRDAIQTQLTVDAVRHSTLTGKIEQVEILPGL